MRNLAPKVKLAAAIQPQTVTATVTSAALDTADFGSNGFVVSVGAGTLGGANTITPTMFECADVAGTYTEVATADLYAAKADATASSIAHIEYKGSLRYVKMKLVVAGTVSNPCSVTSLQGHSEFQPAL